MARGAKTVAMAAALAIVATGCGADRGPGPDTNAPGARRATPVETHAIAQPVAAEASTGRVASTDPDATIPEAFRATWAADAIACRRPAHESRLTLQANHVSLYDGAGPVKSVVVDGNNITILARLTSEGQTGEATYAFHLSDDGNTLTDTSTGPGMVRQRCADAATR